MPWLVDTNVLSELVRPRPNRGVLEWAATLSNIGISVITVEEICFGLAWNPNPHIHDWFNRFFHDSCDVLQVSQAIARQAGQMRGELRRQGWNRSQADLLIAATAQVHGLTLVTRNVRDFERCHIPLFNPFS